MTPILTAILVFSGTITGILLGRRQLRRRSRRSHRDALDE